MENPNPDVDEAIPSASSIDQLSLSDIANFSSEFAEKLTADEIYHLLREIKDPEHPELSLSQLRVVRLGDISVFDSEDAIAVEYTPTIPTCSVAVLIGLTLLKKLQLCVPSRFKISVKISPGKHVQEKQVNKQLADKERVAAAMENPNLSKMVREGVYRTDTIPEQLLIW